MAGPRLPTGAVARTPLKDLAARLSPTLYGPDGRPARAAVVEGDPFSGREPGPGQPLTPKLGSGPPRQWMPWAGYNLSYAPRSEFKQLTPFAMLRNLADLCEIVSACINDVKQQMLGLTWEIKAKDKTSQAQTSEIERVRNFLRFPDGTNDSATWLSMMIDEILVTDALSMYRHRTKAGDPYALLLVDGATIKPLADYMGIAPTPPAPAYQQIIEGLVEREFTRPWRTADRRDPGGGEKHELVYAPFSRRTTGPYGQSPVERVILTVNLILRRQQHYLAFYTEGNVPEAFWKCPEDWTAEQIEAGQVIFDQMLAGNAQLRSRLRLMPGGEGTGLENPRGDDRFSVEFEELLYAVVSYQFNVSSQPYRKMMNRATAEQADVAETDSGLKPLSKRIKARLDIEIEEFLGYAGVEFVWADTKGEDERLKMEKNVAYVGSGIYSVDEVREAEGKAPFGAPPFTETGAGLVKIGPELEVVGAKPGPGGQGAPGLETPSGGSAAAALAAAPAIPAAAPGGQERLRMPAPSLTRAAQEDLRRWKKIALKEVAAGRSRRAFETTAIPTALRTALAEWMEHASTREDVLWGFSALTRARHPLLQARKRIRLERGLRRAALEYFREHAPALAVLAADALPTEQRDEVARKIPEGPTDEAIDAAMEWKVLAEKARGHIEAAFAEGGDLAVRKVGEEAIAFGLVDEAAADYAEARAAELVGMTRLDDGTLVPNPNAKWSVPQGVRDRIRGLVKQAAKEGWTRRQLTAEIESDEVWGARADMIARTEVATAVNQGAATTYREAGVVDGTVLDGPGCLEDGHDDNQAGVNGETWTLERFRAHVVGHPHCRRDFAPNVPKTASEAA